LFLAAPVAVLAMFNIVLPGMFFGHNLSIWIQATLSTLVILVLGWQFHIGMLRQARTLSANMDTLISLGTLAALFFSIWAMFAGSYAMDHAAMIYLMDRAGRFVNPISLRTDDKVAIERLREVAAL
jgi:copper-transporting P-type ATPase V